jgi:hypothetical protein
MHYYYIWKHLLTLHVFLISLFDLANICFISLEPIVINEQTYLSS